MSTMEIVEPMSPESVQQEAQNNFTCMLCQARLNSSTDLSEHFKDKHGPPNDKDNTAHECIICKMLFSTKHELTKHHEKHTPTYGTARGFISVKRKLALGGRECKSCRVGHQVETCFRHPFDEYIICGVCYNLNLQGYLVQHSSNKETGSFIYDGLLVSDYMQMHSQRRRPLCRMSQIEIDARVKAITEDLKHKQVDKEELINNYGLTVEDYEKSLELLDKEITQKPKVPLKIKILQIADHGGESDVNRLESDKKMFVRNQFRNTAIELHANVKKMAEKIEATNIKGFPGEQSGSVNSEDGYHIAQCKTSDFPVGQNCDQGNMGIEQKNGQATTPLVIRPDISKLYETYNLISPSSFSSPSLKSGNSNLTALQDGLFSTVQTNRRNRVLKPKRENICVNCGCKNATLWRKLKSADEVQIKRPEITVDRSKDFKAGQLACNPCALYWSMHGRHRLKEHTVDYVPLRRKSKNHPEKISGIDTGPPTLVNINSQLQDQFHKVIADITESWSSSSDGTCKNDQNIGFDNSSSSDISPWLATHIEKLITQTTGTARLRSPTYTVKRKVDSDSTDSADDEIATAKVIKLENGKTEKSLATRKQTIQALQKAEHEISLENVFKCTICNTFSGDIENIKTCFMCPNKVYCADCLLSIVHLLRHSKLNNFTSLRN